jgi:alkanesulfonate monooxygenase
MPAKRKQTVFGIAMRNFTKYPEMPSAQGLIEYGVRMEELGYESVWAWDHILLGVDPNFPIHEALTILTAIAARTTKIKVGTGILVMPMRNPVILAKELATIDHISNGRLIVGAAVGWYKREFDSMGVEFTHRGKLMEQSLEIINRLWTEDKVDGDYPPYKLRGAVLFPKPVQKPRPPLLIGGYVDAVLKRAATKGDGWLTYYYTAESFARVWAKVRGFAEEAGRNPDELISTNQLPICVGPRAKVEAPMKHWLQTEWDYASWSESTMDSAIMGTADECVEQLEKHIATGIDRIIFVPYKYEADQVEAAIKRYDVDPDTVDPYVEEGHVLLIRVYEALGETTRAAAAYDRYQRIVRHELAAEPRPALVLRFEGQTSAGSALPSIRSTTCGWSRTNTRST